MKRKKRLLLPSKIWAIVLLVLWTCLFLGMSIRQYFQTESWEERIAQVLVEQGLSGKASIIEKKESATEEISYKILSGFPLLQYIFHQQENSNPEENCVIGQLAESQHKKEEKEAAITQNIVLFSNGSTDITQQNHKKASSPEKIPKTVKQDSGERLKKNRQMLKHLQKTQSRSYLLRKFYITDSSTSIDRNVFQCDSLLHMNLKIKKEKKPQILIFHTHGASEAFIDSRKGKKEDSIVGVGETLAQILSSEYGYQVIHDKTEYDCINGKIDRNKAYNNAYEGVTKILKKHPSIQVVIDLHRDGVGNKVKRTTVIDGRRTAQVMFFNGLSRNSSGNIAYLKNENLQGNLAFSLQLKMACMKRFADFARPVYLKSYRYNMHLRKRYTLIELGNENNTVAEAKNAMAPLAMALHSVLAGEKD